MALLIQTTGLEQYAPGGHARIKVMVIGGPGVGKTRWASYFPKPIYADTEKGLASVADRQVPFVNVNTSQDMLDLLTLLKQECRLPPERRRWDTVVIDTLDAYQRKVKQEWMEKQRVDTFTGWEAWAFLTNRMQTLLTRLLTLDMNVIVNVHYKDKTTRDDETGREAHTFMLQLQGETADTAFNDFDLVGWMGTYWKADEGERIQKRGLTFTPTPDKPFLKDRLHATPSWLDVTFSAADYEVLFDRVAQRVAELKPGETVGEVPAEGAQPQPPNVVSPDAAGSGPLPEQQPREQPLDQLDKPTLAKICRDEGVTTTVAGAPLKGNALKSEYLAALKAHRAARPTPPSEPEPEPAAEPTVTANPAEERARRAQGRAVANAAIAAVDEGRVNTATGELLDEDAAHKGAVATVADKLGGEVVAETVDAPRQEPAPQQPPPAASASAGTCEVCGKSLAKEDPNLVKLGRIKYRAALCAEDYQKRKKGAR